MGNFNRPPENRLLAEIRELRALVQASNSRTLSVPVVDEDPDVDSPANLWMMADGRLRGRRPDGTIMQYATTTPGSTTSLEPLPDPDYEPASYEYLYPATWQRAFKGGGPTPYNNPTGRMFYGDEGLGDGEYVSMAGFPNLSELAPGVDGIIVTRVQAYIENVYTYLAGGTTIRIGLHNQSSAPVVFSETVAGVVTVPVLPTGGMWVDLPVSVGEALSAGTAKGVTFHQAQSAKTYYGYADSIQLKIAYIK